MKKRGRKKINKRKFPLCCCPFCSLSAAVVFFFHVTFNCAGISWISLRNSPGQRHSIFHPWTPVVAGMESLSPSS
ncbi:hypothetical protein GDO81_023521 [Engystomops pustulosus]|uniref:Secreted protein n=1 Tax=Engystomops pustulosus TaxID=76066 RepID=A0AAV6Z2P1_ENGPU|nr:hypothetical protein GDO81_023521 [Engystomops pustulosus]